MDAFFAGLAGARSRLATRQSGILNGLGIDLSKP